MKYYVYLLQNIKRIKKRVYKSNFVLKKKAMQTHNCYSGVKNFSTMDQMLQLLAYKYADDMLKSLYEATVSCLKLLDKDAVLLLSWYKYDADRKQIALQYGYSMRTMYRKVNTAMQRFVNKMQSLGYDEQWFEQQKSKLGLCA